MAEMVKDVWFVCIVGIAIIDNELAGLDFSVLIMNQRSSISCIALGNKTQTSKSTFVLSTCTVFMSNKSNFTVSVLLKCVNICLFIFLFNTGDFTSFIMSFTPAGGSKYL